MELCTCCERWFSPWMFGGNSEALWRLSVGSPASASPLGIEHPRKLPFDAWKFLPVGFVKSAQKFVHGICLPLSI